jgi:hypothetical protein
MFQQCSLALKMSGVHLQQNTLPVKLFWGQTLLR